MNQEFITSIGKVIRERDVLFLKTLKGGFTNTIVYENGYPFVVFIIFCLQFIRWTEVEFFYYYRIVFWAILFSTCASSLYDTIAKKSFAKSNPLNRIKSFDIKEGESELETVVIIHLKNGRYRKIAFRTLEKQYEPFTELLSQYSMQLQVAQGYT